MDGLDCSRASLYHLDDLLSTDGLERVIEDFLGRGGKGGEGLGMAGKGWAGLLLPLLLLLLGCVNFVGGFLGGFF